MDQLTEFEINKGYRLWLSHYAFCENDRTLQPFVTAPLDRQIEVPVGGWLKCSREALFLSPGKVAETLNLGRSTFQKFEENEKNGTISIATLQRCAEAMDCEFVYAIRPKGKKLFSRTVWDKIVPHAVLHPWIRQCDPKNKAGALSFLVRRTFSRAQFRKEMGWSQRANAPMS